MNPSDMSMKELVSLRDSVAEVVQGMPVVSSRTKREFILKLASEEVMKPKHIAKLAGLSTFRVRAKLREVAMTGEFHQHRPHARWKISPVEYVRVFGRVGA